MSNGIIMSKQGYTVSEKLCVVFKFMGARVAIKTHIPSGAMLALAKDLDGQYYYAFVLESGIYSRESMTTYPSILAALNDYGSDAFDYENGIMDNVNHAKHIGTKFYTIEEANAL